MTPNSTPNPRLVAIVPAAGIGARAALPGTAGLAKQYREIAGKPLLWHSVNALLRDARIDQVRVIVSPGDTLAGKVLESFGQVVVRDCGGASRAETVLSGLRDAALAPGDWVLVHDAARPGLPSEALDRLISACLEHPVGGLLALPVPDTIKRARPAASLDAGLNPIGSDADAASESVQGTVSRAGLWAAQTPQMFKAGPLAQALAGAIDEGRELTDESSAMELTGASPLLVRGSVRNAKVTWPEDFEWVGSWL